MGYVRVIKHEPIPGLAHASGYPRSVAGYQHITYVYICVHIYIYTHTYMYNWLYVYNINISYIKPEKNQIVQWIPSNMWRLAPVSQVEEKTSPHSWLVRSWLRPSLGGNGMFVSRVGSLFWVVAIRGSRRRKRGRRSRRRRENILVVWKEYTAVNKYFPTPASNEIHLSIYRSCISGWNMIRPK